MKNFNQHTRRMPRHPITTLLCLLAVIIAYSFGNLTHAAAPPAGATIGNQASATYSDASQVSRTVTSNAVVTIVQQVASFTLTAGGTKTGAIGGQVVYPHTITNTGNGTDTFGLAVTSNTGTTTLGSVAFYADANGDGVPDNSTAVTSTGELAAGAVFKFVVAGNVSGTAVAGNTNALIITATSGYTGSVTASNTDNTTVTGQAVIQVTQALDVTSGASPAGPRTITITYTNVGNATASNVTLGEIIPSGMTYVATSARWSVTGSATVLTDASNADSQSGIIYDYNVTTSTRVTAVIASVAAGASGTLTFQVNINSGLAPGANSATAATATFAYNDGASNISATNTNTVQYVVAQTATVLMSSSTVASAVQGGTVTFTNTVTNNGNGTDSFNISTGTSVTPFPTGTTFQFYQADGVTPLLDSNADGIPDTGPVAGSGGTYNVIVKAILPSNATGGAFTVPVTATSRVDGSKSATGTDTLTAISTNTVDVTNNSAGAAAPGYGAGPELTAAVTNAINPAATTRFTLVIANNSTTADSFDLAASTDSNFASNTVPSGWTVVFKDSNGTVITNSGVINASSNKTIYADVTPATSAAAGTTDLYFRVRSPTSGATDRLHDAVTVNTVRGVSLAPNQSGQTTSGGVVVYSHTIMNTGNVLEGATAGTITLAVSNNITGFTSVIYWDKNNNGLLDVTDPVISDLSALTGGSNGASTAAGLSPGESALLLVKVIAPAGAAVGAIDTSTLTATITGTINSIAAPSAVLVTDNTTVIASQVTLSKLQALDAACDGTADTTFSAAGITSGAIPGACIRYEITATNLGSSDITGLVISDATPSSTTYHATVAAATSSGSITSVPSGGSAGTVQATISTLSAGQSVTLSFGVRITP
ncbi:MAG: hypothetical protein QM808_14180 [Steroidobacteraceae bacterium]